MCYKQPKMLCKNHEHPEIAMQYPPQLTTNQELGGGAMRRDHAHPPAIKTITRSANPGSNINKVTSDTTVGLGLCFVFCSSVLILLGCLHFLLVYL